MSIPINAIEHGATNLELMIPETNDSMEERRN